MFIIIFNILMSIGLSVLSSFTFWKVNAPIDFYKPLIIFISSLIVLLGVWFIFLNLIGIFFDHKKINKVDRKIAHFFLYQGIQYINIHAGCRVKMVGRSRLPKNNQRFLFVCNHRSNFDPMLAYVLLKDYHIGFITKPSNFKIPMGGRLMKHLYFQGINRDDPLQSLEVMKKATQLMQDGVTSIGVFPEGTRSKDGKTMGEFHEGVFNIAIRSKKPIVVCSLNGTEKVHKRFPRPTKVQLHVLQTLNYEDYAGIPAKQICDNVKALIQEDLNK